MNRVGRERRHLVSVASEDHEPTAAELDEIEREMPLILAEVTVVEAEVALAVSPGSEVARRQHRRATRRVLAEAAAVRLTSPVEVA